jgi:hypothetical protein
MVAVAEKKSASLLRDAYTTCTDWLQTEGGCCCKPHYKCATIQSRQLSPLSLPG